MKYFCFPLLLLIFSHTTLSMDTIPNEVLRMMFEHMTHKQRKSIGRVNSIWNFLMGTFRLSKTTIWKKIGKGTLTEEDSLNGFDVNYVRWTSVWHVTPLIACIRLAEEKNNIPEYLQTLNVLLANGADPNKAAAGDETPLYIALQYFGSWAIESLIKYGMKPAAFEGKHIISVAFHEKNRWQQHKYMYYSPYETLKASLKISDINTIMEHVCKLMTAEELSALKTNYSDECAAFKTQILARENEITQK